MERCNGQARFDNHLIGQVVPAPPAANAPARSVYEMTRAESVRSASGRRGMFAGSRQFKVTDTGAEAMPLATTSSVLAPVSQVAGTANRVLVLAPVEMPMA